MKQGEKNMIRMLSLAPALSACADGAPSRLKTEIAIILTASPSYVTAFGVPAR